MKKKSIKRKHNKLWGDVGKSLGWGGTAIAYGSLISIGGMSKGSIPAVAVGGVLTGTGIYLARRGSKRLNKNIKKLRY